MSIEILSFIPPELLEQFERAWGLLSSTALYWMAPLAVYMLAISWRNYVQAHHKSEFEWVLLEIKHPREIEKPLKAMEIVYAAFHQASDGTWFDRWWKGKLRPWFSLEIASLGGDIHFFIYTQRFHAPIIEAQIYSQYPQVEIHEVRDYTQYVNYRPDSEWEIYGTEFKLEKPDPYPIKTYVDYEIERKEREPAQEVDPITPIIEFMGSIGPDEQIWMQVLIQAAKDRHPVAGSWFKKESWKDAAKKLVKELRKRETQPRPGQIAVYSERLLSPGEERVVKSIERNVDKLGFDVGIRAIYLAKKDAYRKLCQAAVSGTFRQFNAQDMNGFKTTKSTEFKYPWQDFKNIRLNWKKRVIFNAYRRRSYFYSPYERKPFTLSTEELATIYHFPGSVAETPTFHRIPSKTVEPPPNLPT